MSIGEVSRATRIPSAAIERIEANHFDDLPGEVFARGFLKAYATVVGLSADEVLARYTAARRIVAVEPLPMATPVSGSGTRRFGVAIAFVLLLVLFTLALSIVLRPRGHDRPQELSHHDVSAQVDSAQVDSAQVDSAQVDSAQVDSAQVDSAQVDSAQVDGSTALG